MYDLRANSNDSMMSSALINSCAKKGAIQCALYYWLNYFYFILLASPKKQKKIIQRNETKIGDRDTATAEANFSGPVFVISSIRIGNSVICSDIQVGINTTSDI